MILKATPIEEPESVTDPSAFLARLEDLTHDEDFRWAADTLEGIYETVCRTDRVTAGQLRAIDNIEGAHQGAHWR